MQKALEGITTWTMSVFVNTRGSLDETLSHLIASHDLGYCPLPLYQDLRGQIGETRRLLNGYITWLKAKKIGESEPGAKLIIHEIPPEYLVATE